MDNKKSGAALPKVLVVDDVQANLVAFKAVLTRLPVEIITASSGREALSLLLRHKFAVILLDVQMPEIDGYETATLIRNHSSHAPVPIVFITAGDRSVARELQGYESGAIDYLFKPVNDRLLLSKVSVLVDLYIHQQQLEDSRTALSRLNKQLSNLLRGVNEGIVGLNRHGAIEFINPSACKLFGGTPHSLWNTAIADRLSPALRERQGKDFESSPMAQQARSEDDYRESRASFLTVSGETIPVQFSLSCIDGGAESGSSYVLVFQDISDQIRAQAILRKQAEHDELTGLPNRLVFRNTMAAYLQDLRGDSGFFVLYMDLNGFKPINDTHGHEVGDAMLRHVAWQMSGALRQEDLLARIGGDEFAALIKNKQGLNEAEKVAEKLVSAVAVPFSLDGVELRVGVSIGIAEYPRHGDDAETLVRCADAAMYQAKASPDKNIVVAD